MQAISALPAAPQPAPAPTDAPSAGAAAGESHFSRHLKDARQQADKTRHDAQTAAEGRPRPKGKPEEKPSDNEHTIRATGEKHPAAVHKEHNAGDEDKKDSRTSGTDGTKEILRQLLQNSSLQHILTVPDKGTTKAGEPILTDKQPSGITQADKPVSLSTRDGQAVLADLLAKATDEQPLTAMERMHTESTGQQLEKIPEKMVVEGWQAQFTHTKVGAAAGQQRGTTAQTVNESQKITINAQGIQASTVPVIPQSQETQASVAQIAGQTQGIQASVAPVALQAPAHGTPGSNVQAPNQPQDANANFIHSSLPGVTTTNPEAESGNEQQPGQSGKNSTQNSPLPQGAETPARPAGLDITPVFSLDQTGTTTTQPSASTNTTAPLLHLPSGIEVPHSQIIDQVTGHFNMSRQLESGNVTIRLHPAELGELRMEIKVEQDNIKAHITAQNPQVQDILDRNLPRLRQALEQQGMNLAHIQVNVASDGSSNSQLFQEQFNRQQFKRPAPTATNDMTFSLPEEKPDEQYRIDPLQNLSVHI